MIDQIIHDNRIYQMKEKIIHHGIWLLWTFFYSLEFLRFF